MRTHPKNRVIKCNSPWPATGCISLGHHEGTESVKGEGRLSLESDGGGMYIYMVTNDLDGLSYVGQSRKDSKGHEWYLGSGHRIVNAVKKHGREHFKKVILEDDITDSKTLDEREQFWIVEMNTMKPNGYNLREGGTNWQPLSPEAMAERSARQKARCGPLNAKYGKKMSSHQYAKLRPYWDSQKGKARPQLDGAIYRREPVVQFTLAGQYVATFESQEAAAKAVGKVAGGISECVHGDRIHCGRFQFMSLEDYDLIRSAGATVPSVPMRKIGSKLVIVHHVSKNSIPVIQLTPSGEYVKLFPSMAEAARLLGISLQSVYNVLFHRQEITCGWSFMFEDEYYLALSVGARIGPFVNRRSCPRKRVPELKKIA